MHAGTQRQYRGHRRRIQRASERSEVTAFYDQVQQARIHYQATPLQRGEEFGSLEFEMKTQRCIGVGHWLVFLKGAISLRRVRGSKMRVPLMDFARPSAARALDTAAAYLESCVLARTADGFCGLLPEP